MSNVTLNGLKNFWYGIGLLVLAVSAQGASFDCGKAQTKVEHIICDNPEISKLDDELSTAYKSALNADKQGESIKQAQKQWMKERDVCPEAACVKQAYEMRLGLLARASSNRLDVAEQDANGNSAGYRRFHFQLTKGTGTPVCDAYLKRLNLTSYEEPPFCDRPEIDSVEGFTKLNRVSLTPVIANSLYPIVWNFDAMANKKDLNWSDVKVQQQFVSRYKGTSTTMQNMLNRDSQWAKIWRYDPPVDIDNDGVPDNVQVWYGSVLTSGVGGTRCGESGTKFDGLVRQPQIPFVIAYSNDRLEAEITKAIFGHPSGGYRLSDGTLSYGFRPIGFTIGIFKYRDTYYFDTFFDGWGDFEGKRRKDKNISNTLAVFLHKDGNTKQVCEFLMMDNEANDEGETK